MPVNNALQPLLRPLDVRRIAHNGAPYFLLRDPLQLSDHQLLVPQHMGPALAHFDGSLTIAAICARVLAAYNLRLRPAAVQELADALDDACLLENDRFRARRAAALAAYRDAPCRPPALAGTGYPAEADALWALLQDYLEEAEAVTPAPINWAQGVALLSPHIDYARGGPVYAQVWKQAAQAVAEAELAVIFGTDHSGDDPITLTRQHYATPYGTLPTDLTVVDALAAALTPVLGADAPFAGELRHRSEHSLELPAVWLHHMRASAGRASRAGSTSLPLVPILCGSLHGHLANGSTPADDAALAALLAALRRATAGRKVLYIASGDLAHVGPAFGGAPLDAAARTTLRRADRALLRPLAQGDADGFFAAIKQVQNRNNVCGVAPLYLTLRALGSVRGVQAGYAVCPADAETTSVVSVAGMLFQGG